MSWVDELLALFMAVEREIPRSATSEGVIASGSWNAAHGTVQFMDGETMAISPDEDDDQPLVVDDFPMATMALGDQYAPTGNERVVAVPTPSGYVMLIVHGEDDSPNVPSGERWICHYNSAGQIDAFFKHTNDADTPGDGKGGAHYGGNAALTQMTTKGGHSYKQSDTTKQIIDSTAGGNKTVKDDTTNEISHVTQNVGLGDVVANLTSENAAMRHTDLSAFENSLKTQRLNDLSNLATAVAGALASASPPVTISASAIIALIASLAHITVPSGSSIVKIK